MTRLTLRPDAIDRLANQANGSFRLSATELGYRLEIDRRDNRGSARDPERPSTGSSDEEPVFVFPLVPHPAARSAGPRGQHWPHQQLAGGPAVMSTETTEDAISTPTVHVTALPQVRKPGKVPIRSWAPDLEGSVLEEATNVSNLPFAIRHVALMPDGYAGYGMPIGGVLFADGAVYGRLHLELLRLAGFYDSNRSTVDAATLRPRPWNQSGPGLLPRRAAYHRHGDVAIGSGHERPWAASIDGEDFAMADDGSLSIVLCVGPATWEKHAPPSRRDDEFGTSSSSTL